MTSLPDDPAARRPSRNIRRPRCKPPIPPAIRQAGFLRGEDWIYYYWDRDGILLYVGCGAHAGVRAEAHRGAAKWWRFVARGHAERVSIDGSMEREREPIRTLMPVFNIAHSETGSVPRIKYCARREAWDLVDEEIGRMRNGPEAYLLESLAA